MIKISNQLFNFVFKTNFAHQINFMNNTALLSKLAHLPKNFQIEVSKSIDYLICRAKKEKSATQTKSKFGIAKGMFIMSPDFDAPLEDFKDYM